jgi:hypothetical protein
MITPRSFINWSHGTIYLRQKSRWWRDIWVDCDNPYKMPSACTRCGLFLRLINVHVSQRSSRTSGQWSEVTKAIALFAPKNLALSSRHHGGNSNPNIKCFRCGELGHKATECRKPASQKGKNLLLKEDLVDYKYDDDGDDDVLNGDRQENLVIRKSLLTPKGDSGDEWLRTNIFHTTCTVADKVCKMIIDSGSCENVASEEAI